MDLPSAIEQWRRPRGFARGGVVIAVLIVALGAWGLVSAHRARAQRQEAVDAQSVVTVTTTTPQASSEAAEVTLPGSVQANYEAPIYARTAGYLKRWLVDIGTPVQGWPVARRDRCTGTRSAAAPGGGGCRDGARQSGHRQCHSGTLARTARHGFRVETGSGREDQLRRDRRGTAAIGRGQRAATAGAVRLQEDRCAVRRRGHRAQHGCGAAHQRRQQLRCRSCFALPTRGACGSTSMCRRPTLPP